MIKKSVNIKPRRPEPFNSAVEILAVNKYSDFHIVSNCLYSGRYVLIEDVFSTGLTLVHEIKSGVFADFNNDSFKTEREKRNVFQKLSNQVLVPIKNNKIALKKSPDIGWLKILYPDIKDFFISFPQVQGLNSSWQWYKKGIFYPGLDLVINPYYGTYFPTRTEHLFMFNKWLMKYSGERKNAIDIGTGCGVLAFQMIKQGFKKVYASDINENAIISTSKTAAEYGLSQKLKLFHSDLFGEIDISTELIVCNPPWLPAEDSDISGIDTAIYYEAGFFDRFFEQAAAKIKKNGKIVMFFSNFAQFTGLSDSHPIISEIEKAGRLEKVEFLQKKVKKASRKSKRTDRRKQEFVELWVLQPK